MKILTAFSLAMCSLTALIGLCVIEIGCTPIERQAYNVFVGAKAFLDAEKKMHPECAQASAGVPSALCVDLSRATAAKDLLIDAAEAYCAGPQFEVGKACEPPAKGTPAYDQAVSKLKAAITNYNQTAADLKGVL